MIEELAHERLDHVVDKRYQIENLINMDDLRKLLDDFHKIAPFPVALLNLNGEVLLESHWEPICTQFHRVHPKTAAICTESDTHFSAALVKGDERHILYRCGNGLYDAASPIIIAGQHLGNFFIGQFLLESPDEGFFRKQAQQYGFEEEKYLEALSRVPIISEHDLQNRLDYLCDFAEFLGNVGLKEIERDRTEEVLKAALVETRRFRKALDEVPSHVYMKDPQSRYIYANRMTLKLFGCSSEELVGRDDTHFFPPDTVKRLREVDLRVFASEHTFEEIDVASAGSERRVYLEVKTPIYEGAERKRIWGLLGISTDITERKRTEEALRESEEKYRTILASIEDGYFEVDIAGNFTFFNDSLCKIVGYSKDELMGMNNRQYTDEENAKKLYQTFNKVYTIGKPDKGFGWEIIRKDGTKIVVEASISLRSDAGGEPIGFRGVVRDISEKQRLEAQLQQTQKMEAIAILAGGIAHNFNNALTPIIGNVDLLEMTHGNDENTMKSLKDMKTSGLRMALLTSQLLAYAKGGKYNPQVQSLGDFVDATLPLIQHTLDPAVRVETDLSLDVMNAKADSTQMQMVLSAIMANSNEAMEGPGRIRISTRNIDLDQAFIKDHPGIKPGPYVCLSIEDDGKGMDEEIRSRIFDPFFTTHFMGRGLGMASVYGIIKNHDGTITVDSELGKGTVVHIYLPAIEAEEKLKGVVVSKPEIELPTGDASILVIEDEEQVMMLFRQTLEMLGYRVLQAETGKKAIELAKTFDGHIDLAILDIKLPDMTGDKVYPIIMEARPDLKVIVCSGYGIEGPPQEILDAGAEGFVQKPFHIVTLAEKLKEVLGEK